MSEQKREVVHDIFINVHCIALSNLPWALAQIGLFKLHPILFPDRKTVCVYHTECLRTRLAPPLIQMGTCLYTFTVVYTRKKTKIKKHT